MKLSTIYKNAHTTLSKDGDDGVISMDRFNSLLESINLSFIKDKLEEQFTLTPQGFAIPKSLYSSKIINNLVRRANISVSTDGSEKYFVASNPSLMYFISASCTYNDTFKKLDLISDEELRTRLSNVLSKPIDENPVLIQRVNKYLYCWPTDITLITLSYIGIPETPHLDYYIDANYNKVFMNEGDSIYISNGMQYSNGSTSGIAQSKTKELQIPEDMHPAFQDYLIEKLSIMIGDQYINQVSMAKEQVDQSK
ncbi:hypothetical protein JW865_09385 [Candidatus Bathyarchaeota archaeon]|nr:hypothetical protein [Candidatus Bathyarchaeota archaeon]